MPVRFQNSFGAGYLDPLMYSRVELKKWASGCVQMDNVVTIPQGGFKRRPGTKFVASYAPGTTLRTKVFAVGYSVQYLLVFVATDATRLDVYSTADVLLTSLNMPYTGVEFAAISFAQELDTMILFHQDIAPHRMLRSTLESVSIGAVPATRGPLETTSGSPLLLVRHLDHGLVDGDAIGISNASAIGGFTTTDLNTSMEVTRIDGAVTANSVSCTELTNDVTVTLGSGHGFVAGERVELRGLVAITLTDTVSGNEITTGVIPASELNRIQTITATSATTVTFEVPTTVPEDRGTASGNVTLGGSAGTWNAVDKYYATNGDMPNASSTVTAGGGAAPLVWSLSSLAPDATRKVALTNVPKFNFRDAQSPAPGNERQRITFSGMSSGNRYNTEIEGSAGAGSGFGSLEYYDDMVTNAQTMQDRFNDQAERTGIRVEYDEIGSAAAGSGYDVFVVTFQGDAAERDWDTIIVTVTKSTAGTADVLSIGTGGSTEEPVWSDTRGWPRSGVFHQRRLWMVASASRPLTVWASVPEDFFNFEVADQQPSDAIDNTGQFDPIRYIVEASTGLHLLTTGGVVDISPDRDTGGYQHPLSFKQGDSAGATSMAPVVLAGLVIYEDTIGRGIRQIRFDEADRLVSDEVSQLAQSLIGGTLRIETVRNDDGDYCYVVNGNDGSIACLNLDVPQKVLGWSRFVTDGEFLDLAEVGGFMYAVVDRELGRYIEKFDPAYFTDSGVIQSGSDETEWSGLEHLEGETVDVRGNEATLDQATVTGGAITSQAGGLDYECFECEVGLPFDVAVQPTPVVATIKSRLIRATVDVYQSREFSVGGYPVVTRNATDLSNPPPLVDGFWKVPLRGWSQRATVAIAQRSPQPLVVRGIEVEAA